MLNKLKNLKIAYKLGLVAALMCIPVTVLGVLFVMARNDEVAGYQKIMESLDYLAPVHRLQQGVLLHRGLIYIVQYDASYKPQLAANEAQIETSFTELQKVDSKLGRKFGTTEQLNHIREAWQGIKAKVGVFSFKEMYEAETRLDAQILELVRVVGDNGMVLDPSLDTSYLGNELLLQIPSTAEFLGQLRYAGSDVLLNGAGGMSEEQRIRLVSSLGTLRRLADSQSGRLGLGMRMAFKNNQRLEEALSAQTSASLTALETFMQYEQDNFLKGKVTAVLKDHFAVGVDAFGNLFKLYDQIAEAYRAETLLNVAASNRAKYIQLAIAFLSLFAAGMLTWRIGHGINRQASAMTGLFGSIGMGDFSARAEVQSEDELGQTARGLNAMLDNTMALVQSQEERDRMQESIQKLLEEISGVAEGDLTQHAEVTAEMTGAIADSFNNMIEELRNIIAKVQDTTLAVSSSANEVQSTTEHLAHGSEAQAMQIVEASAAIDEMAMSIQQVAGNASSAAGVAGKALENAKQGTESVQRTIEGMNGIRQQVQQTAKRIKRLGESSQEIGEIVQLINDIADRTSILALNASIQAAMAGEAGKGFAVVAEEVERLADRSTEATKKISGLIKSIQTDTNEAIAAMEETTREVVGGSTLANEAGQKLSEIENVSTQLADLLQSISMASKQQTRGSESVARSMSDISQVTQQTAAGAKQAAVSIRKLSELADELRGSLDRFRLPAAA